MKPLALGVAINVLLIVLAAHRVRPVLRGVQEAARGGSRRRRGLPLEGSPVHRALNPARHRPSRRRQAHRSSRRSLPGVAAGAR